MASATWFPSFGSYRRKGRFSGLLTIQENLRDGVDSMARRNAGKSRALLPTPWTASPSSDPCGRSSTSFTILLCSPPSLLNYFVQSYSVLDLLFRKTKGLCGTPCNTTAGPTCCRVLISSYFKELDWYPKYNDSQR